MKQHFLVKTTTYFVDPHGTPDEGGIKKFVTQNPIYARVDPNTYYNEEIAENYEYDEEEDIIGFLEEASVDEDEMQAMDGYNLEVYKYKVKKITPEQAKAYKQFIKDYDTL